MKKDRDCNCNQGMTPYPVYPNYIPGMGMPMINNGYMQNPNMMLYPSNQMGNLGTNFQQNSSTIEQQLYNLNNQINSLERRVANLENLVGNVSTQYNTSNYQVM